jgi:hypothetical protein
MKKIKAVKFTISMFSILNLSALFGQSTPSAIKFLNCEWGILPAEAIAALEQGSVDIDIKEDKNLEYENRAKGIREFVTCIFRLKADSDSVSIRTPIPVQSGHRFRLIPATFLRGPESEAALDNLPKMGQDASFERRSEWPERGYPCEKFEKP